MNAPGATVATADGAAAPVQAQGARRANSREWWGLAVLMLLGLLVVLDKQVFVLQVEPIRKALALSDLQIGLVQGLSVALFAAVVAYPIAWIADRFDARFVLVSCVGAWSLCVALTGLSTSFTEMFIFSALVGAGEAGLLPIAYAYIPRVFLGSQRVLANSIFMAVGRFSSGFVIAASGYLVASSEMIRPMLPAAIANAETWRIAFVLAAIVGVPFCLLIATMPRPPRSDAHAGTSSQSQQPREAAPPVLPFVKTQLRPFVTFWIGMGLSVFGYTAALSFAPVVAMRQFNATPVEVGNAMGAATLIATVVGLLVTNLGVKWLARFMGERVPVLMLAGAALVGCAPIAAMAFATSSRELFIALGVLMTCLMAGAMLFPTAIQDMAPVRLRARLISIVILVNTVLSALAPVVVGAVSDAIGKQADALLVASVATAVIGLLISAALLVWCAASYPGAVAAARAWERED